MEGGTLIGIVGYSPVLDCYPLGPRLMQALEDGAAPGTKVENMSWSPIHIVQRFQDAGAERPKRLILVGGASASTTPGAIRTFRWTGGTLAPAAVQERVYEAVTGVVDIENTLMIGEQFGVWPTETFSVELDLPAETFGDMVIADSEGRTDDARLAAFLGFSPVAMIAEAVRVTLALARAGSGAEVGLRAKSAEALVPVGRFIRNFARVSATAEGGRP